MKAPARGIKWMAAVGAALAVQAAGAAEPATVRVWGVAEAAPLAQRWAAGFMRQNPGVKVTLQMTGSDVALGALTTGKADVALMGRDNQPQETKGFEWIYRYKPLAFDVAAGSLDKPGRSPALGVLVHKDNPLAQISIPQLDALFDAERRLGAKSAITTWDGLGVAGAWKGQAIRLYAPHGDSGTGVFFEDTALGGTRAMNWARVTEFDDSEGHPTKHDMGRKLQDAVAADRMGLAVAPLSAPLPAQLKLVPVAPRDGTSAVLPTAETLGAGAYPLGRKLRAYVNAAPAKPIDPKMAHPIDAATAAFVRYLLSAEGQKDVKDDGQYLPLAPAALPAQQAKLP